MYDIDTLDKTGNSSESWEHICGFKHKWQYDLLLLSLVDTFCFI